MSDVLNFPREVLRDGKFVSVVERPGEHRYGNASKKRMEIRYGNLTCPFKW